MSNDIKKYIDLSKLYTEVDLEKNQKVEEGLIDWIKDKFGLTDAESDEAVNDLLANVDDETKKKIDQSADQAINKPKDAPRDGGNPGGTTTAVEPNADTTGGQDLGNGFQLVDTTVNGKNIKGVLDTQSGTTFVINDSLVRSPVRYIQIDKNGKLTPTADLGPETMKAMQDSGLDNIGNIAQSSAQEFKNMADAQLNTDKVKKGDTVKIGGVDHTVDATDTGEIFYTQTSSVGDDSDDDSTDVTAGIDGPADAAAQQADTKDLMTRYNEGGKKAMPEIKKLQTELSRLGFDPNGIDGKYGNGTYAAVQAFQKANGLAVDGQAGPNTLAAIEKAIKGDTGDAKDAKPADTGDAKDAKPADTGDAKEVPSTTDDAMDPKNQQQDIDTAQPNADLDRYIELLNKLEGGSQEAGVPNADRDAQERGVAVAETDLRKLIAIVEATLLAEQLTDAEMAELEALHTKIQGYVGMPGMDDQKIENALNRYLKVKGATSTPNASTAAGAGKADAADAGTDVDKKGPDGQYDGDDLGNAPTAPPKVTLDTISATIKKGITFDQLQKAVTDAEALEPEDAAKDANLLKKLGAKAKQLVSTKEYRARYVLAKGAQQLGIDGLYRPDGKTFIFMKDGQPSGARGGSLNSAMQVAQLGLLPPKKVEDFKKLAPNKPKFQAILDAHAKATGEGGADAVANANVAPSKELNLTATGTNNFNIKRNQPFVDIMDSGKKTRVYGDPALLKKRYPDQKINQPTKESTMKKAIKEASMNISMNGSNAAEVAELVGILKNAGIPQDSHSHDMPPMQMDPHDDMVSKMSMMDEPAPGDSGCGMEEDWDNSPEEAYADHQTMTHDLSGGINRRKPKGAERAKDPAVALETSIRERLWAALNEKVTEGSRGKKKKSRGTMEDMTTEGSRGKKKKSRGTMEGSRGKTSRGKKSRG